MLIAELLFVATSKNPPGGQPLTVKRDPTLDQ